MAKHSSLQSTHSIVVEDDAVTASENGNTPSASAGTQLDKDDMWRMGKKQQLQRNFRFFSIFGFTMVLMATWEAQLT